MNVRVRFAPSPTGYLHLGGARTALYNFLFAKHHEGSFLLRLEDTDQQRSRQEYAASIQKDLLWLGLKWDGEVITQSSRYERYREILEKLERDGYAYPCFCTKEELQKEKESSRTQKIPYRYSRRCLSLTTREREAKKKDFPFCIRLRAKREPIVFSDLIKGEVDFPEDTVDDFIIARSNGTAVYHLTVVVDDIDMGISHIIRGEDHLSNVPKQLLLYRALEKYPPYYAHIPLLIDEQGKRLSKRLGSLSISSFRERGYLPEAMINFLARLGWSYDDKQEIFSLSELIEKFSLEGVSHSAAALQEKKAESLNHYYLQQLSDEALMKEIAIFYGEKKFPTSFLKRCLPLLRPRLKTLSSAETWLSPLLHAPQQYEGTVPLSFLKHLLQIKKDLWEISFYHDDLEHYFRKYCEQEGCKLKEVLQPLRIILTGKKVSFPLLETIELLGKEEVDNRLRVYLEKQTT